MKTQQMNIADIYPDPSQTLLLHRKHQHLSYSERLYVYKLIVNGNQEKWRTIFTIQHMLIVDQ